MDNIEDKRSISYESKSSRRARLSTIITEHYKWTEEEKRKCKVIGDRAGAYVWLCNRTARRYSKICTWTAIVVIVVEFLLGGGGIPSLFATDDLGIIKVVNLIILICIMVLGALKAVFEFLDYQEKIKRQNWASSQYSALFIEIQKIINIPDKYRPNFAEYYSDISAKEQKLLRKTPYIPPDVIKQYYNIMGTNALDRKILFGNTNQIEIMIESGQKTTADVMPSSVSIDSVIKKSASLRLEEYDNINLEEAKRHKSPRHKKLTQSKKTRAKKIDSQRMYALERYYVDGNL